MARPTTAARRYAEAAFELALRDGALDAWRDDLATAAQLVGDDRVLAIVGSPAQPIANRRKMLSTLLDGRVRPQVANLARLLTERGRVDLLPAVASEYRRLLNRHRGVVDAIVTSAAPLGADETAAVRTRVEQMSGAAVELRAVVDPDLIGGLTIRVGDRLLDASVRGRLERLRDQLVAGTR
jgi:F-type H+-transporting ATPase subunit delta